MSGRNDEQQRWKPQEGSEGVALVERHHQVLELKLFKNSTASQAEVSRGVANRWSDWHGMAGRQGQKTKKGRAATLYYNVGSSFPSPWQHVQCRYVVQPMYGVRVDMCTRTRTIERAMIWIYPRNETRFEKAPGPLNNISKTTPILSPGTSDWQICQEIIQWWWQVDLTERSENAAIKQKPVGEHVTPDN